MKLLTDLWNRIIQSDNQPLLDKIKFLENKVEGIRVMWDNEKEQVALLVNENTVLQEQKSDLRAENYLMKGKVLQYEKYKAANKIEFKPVTQYYTWKPHKRIKLRNALQKFSTDEEYIQKYNEFLKSIHIAEYSNIDAQVKHIVTIVQKWINDGDNYDTDKQSFGTEEYWLSPQEAFDYYVTKENEGDCEDLSAFLYGCIVAKLIQQEKWEFNKKRLLRVDVQIMGSGGHALLAWKKETDVWAPIESTFYKERFYSLWRTNKDIFKSMYVEIWHIFDEEGEYKIK